MSNMIDCENERDDLCSECEENNSEMEQTALENQPFKERVANKDGIKQGLIIIVGGFIISGILNVYVRRFFGGSGILAGVISILACFTGVSFIFDAKKKVYDAVCPYCKKEFEFPVNELNAECPQCGKKVIIKDGKYQIVE